MKAVILAGGLGSRLSEETVVKPKPMVEVGGKPILWHIMKIYSAAGINDFVVCCGYKGYVIKEYFANYFLHNSDFTFDLEHNNLEIHRGNAEPWRVTVVDTGDETMTGGRLKAVGRYLDDDEPFCFTYGDGVADLDVRRVVDHHAASGKRATLTAVQPAGRFGVLDMDGATVNGFEEKPRDGGWINAGFFVLSRDVLDLIDGPSTIWEREPLERLAADGQLTAYRHDGFWLPMDTLRDRTRLEELWQQGAPWKVW